MCYLCKQYSGLCKKVLARIGSEVENGDYYFVVLLVEFDKKCRLVSRQQRLFRRHAHGWCFLPAPDYSSFSRKLDYCVLLVMTHDSTKVV